MIPFHCIPKMVPGTIVCEFRLIFICLSRVVCCQKSLVWFVSLSTFIVSSVISFTHTLVDLQHYLGHQSSFPRLCFLILCLFGEHRSLHANIFGNITLNATLKWYKSFTTRLAMHIAPIHTDSTAMPLAIWLATTSHVSSCRLTEMGVCISGSLVRQGWTGLPKGNRSSVQAHYLSQPFPCQQALHFYYDLSIRY